MNTQRARPQMVAGVALTTACAVGLSLLVGAGSAQGQSPSVYAPAAAGASACAWPIVTNAQKVNVAYPDTDATYWTMPYRVDSNTRIEVNGVYPNARFMSFNTYDSSGGAFTTNGVPGAIFDYQIEPNVGSKNPWQHGFGKRKQQKSKGGKFVVRVQQDVPGSAANTIPEAPTGTAAGSIGFLLMRVYLPKGGNFSAITLPSISFVSSTGTTTLQPCSPKQRTSPFSPGSNLDADVAAAVRNLVANALEAGNLAGGPTATPTTTSANPQFARATAATTNSVFPNSASAYVSALFQPNPKNVILVRGKAPRTPARKAPGTTPVPWPAKKYQLRYFSLCNNIYRKPWPVVINKAKNGGTDLGCRADNVTALDRKSRYTYVVAQQSKEKRVTRWPHTTFVPTSLKSHQDQEVLIFRNMLSNANFGKSALNAPQNDNAQDAAAAMGEYYPRSVSCPTRYYLTHGPTACFKKY